MKLEFLIPQYDEDESVIRPLLTSIAIQQNVDMNDIGAVIVNDGSKTRLSDEFLSSFPFPIKYILREHGGVSATRNAALDASTADYVMFCDADDMFMNACGLYIVFREMNGDGFDALTSVFIEETRDPKTKAPIYINHEMDSTFVHGKIYRRSYLLDHKIRWDESLTIHEDSYFNCLAQRLGTNVKYCQQPFYLWKWRDTSVCRHDPKYILKTYNDMLKSSTALVKEFLSRGRREEGAFYATSMVYDAYYMMNKQEWLDQENREYRDKTELRFRDYYLEFKDLFDTIDEPIKAQIIMGMKNRFFQEGLMMESVTFSDWIRHIVSLKA